MATPAWVCRSFEKASHTFTVRDFRRLQGLCRERARMYSCSSGTTRALVAGPFASRPKEWHAISLDYSRLLTSTDRIVQFTSDAIDHESGVPVPYPPLHMHHIHITRGPANHWYETHGDYGYHPVDGYTRVLPEGYCDRSALPWGLLLTQINDVRGDGQDLAMSFDEHAGAAQEEEEEALRNGGPLVQWYLRLVFRLQPDERPCKAVTKLIFWYPVTRFANRDPLARFEVRSEEAVLWWTMTSPVSGLILERPWAHAHRARFAGIVLVEGAYNLKSLGVLGTLHAGDNRTPIPQTQASRRCESASCKRRRRSTRSSATTSRRFRRLRPSTEGTTTDLVRFRALKAAASPPAQPTLSSTLSVPSGVPT